MGLIGGNNVSVSIELRIVWILCSGAQKINPRNGQIARGFFAESVMPGKVTGGTLHKLLALEMPLPSLSQQRRIEAILNEQMAAAEQARRALEEQLEMINQLPEALLRQAFNGEL